MNIDLSVTASTRRVRRYRLDHPRLEWHPAPDVLDIIKHHMAMGNDKCLAGILDGLIRMGHRAVSGNAGRR